MTETFNEMKKVLMDFKEQAKANMRQDKYVQPIMVVNSMKHEGVGIIPIPGEMLHDDSSKESFCKTMKKLIKDEDVIWYIMITEAWMVTRENIDGNIPKPSECDDRIETIQVVGTHILGKTILVSSPFEREKDEIVFNTETISEADTPKGEQAGRFNNLFSEMTIQ